jgi:hypothetical protein
MKTSGGVQVYLHAFLISVVDRHEWSASRPCLLILRGRAPGTHYTGREGGGAVWAPEPVWTLWRKAASLAPAGNRTPIYRSCSPQPVAIQTELARLLQHTTSPLFIKWVQNYKLRSSSYHNAAGLNGVRFILIMTDKITYCHAYGLRVINNNGFWIRCLDLLALILPLHLITTTYITSQSVAV